MSSYAFPPSIEAGSILNNSSPREPLVAPLTKAPTLIAIQGSSERPDKVNLGTLFDRRFRVLKSIPVTFDRSGEGVSAIWQAIDEFGHADSASIASIELARSIVELYSALEREQSNLGPDLEQVWFVLQQHIAAIAR